MSNVTPIIPTDTKFRIIGYNDLYGISTGQTVPNVNDMVIKNNGDMTYSMYYVTSVNSDYTSNLTEMIPKSSTSSIIDFVNAGVEPFTLYFDNSTSPYTIKVDAAFNVSEPSASYAKIFAGTDISSTTGKLISQVYDTNNNLVSNNIPLDTAAYNNLNNNVAIKYVRTANTTANLAQNQTLTMVIYNATGVVIAVRSLRVQACNLISGLNTDAKYVIGIALKSVYPGMTGSTVLYPCNLNYDPVNFRGIVYYQSGQQTELPIDGTIFSIEGMDGYIAGSAASTYSLMLKYQLQNGESGNGNNGSADVYQQLYQLQTTIANTAYSVRLYAYPVWNATTSAYGLKWFVSNYDHTIVLDVTSYVVIQSGSFVGNVYGQYQTLGVSINLNKINASLANFNYTQTIKFMLLNPGNYRSSDGAAPNWFVYNQATLNTPYGGGVFAKYYAIDGSTSKINLAGLYTNFNSWLNAYYTNANPIKPSTGSALVPTHFSISSSTTSITYPIDRWNADLTIPGVFTNNDTLVINFIYQSSTNYSLLLATGVPIYQINTAGNYM